ncbi:MAG: head-tail adaptor protein [Pseudomonadota bacterium]
MPGWTRKLVLEERARTPDGAGGVVEDWAPLGTHWAKIDATRAQERFVGGRQADRVTHIARIRAGGEGDPARPRPDQRFREGDRVFAIVGVAEADDQRRELICWLEEGTLS